MYRLWHAKDIPLETILTAAHRLHADIPSWEAIDERIYRLFPGCPEKVAAYAIEKAVDKGYIDYGVSARTGWLTPKGREKLAEVLA